MRQWWIDGLAGLALIIVLITSVTPAHALLGFGNKKTPNTALQQYYCVHHMGDLNNCNGGFFNQVATKLKSPFKASQQSAQQHAYQSYLNGVPTNPNN